MPVKRIEFDWEERLFVGLRALFKIFNPTPQQDDGHTALSYSDLEERLRMLTQMVAGDPLKTGVSEHTGGLKGNAVLFPATMALSADEADNVDAYIFRAVVSGQLWKEMQNRRDWFQVNTSPLALFLASFEWITSATRSLEKDFFEFAALHDRLRKLNLACRPDPSTFPPNVALLEETRQRFLLGEAVWEDEALKEKLQALPTETSLFRRSGSVPLEIYGELIPPESTDHEMGIPEQVDSPELSSGTECAAPPKDEIERIRFSKEDLEDNMMIHIFEKVETADEYKGGNRQPDSEDELEDHMDALEELDIREVIRGGEEAGSIFKAELRLDATIPDVESIGKDEIGIPYDEWDHRGRRYKRDWCTVYPATIQGRDPAWAMAARGRHGPLIDRLEKELNHLRHRLEAQNRQMDGEEVDLSALVDDWAFRSAGYQGEERLYTRQTRLKRDVAVTLLLDLSLSSDSWVDDQRVLDVSRDAVYVLGETADRLGDSIEVLGFASHTRNRCRVWSILDRGEPWSRGRDRLGLLTPRGYTRIGPALRHATKRLVETPAERRLLILISDGKPNDYDRYEGRHGIADIRHALREAGQEGVQVQALAVDAVARDYLPAMFGPRAWQVLRHPDELPLALTEIYGRMTSV
jgi:nitric oxide reductase NorD protein